MPDSLFLLIAVGLFWGVMAIDWRVIEKRTLPPVNERCERLKRLRDV